MQMWIIKIFDRESDISVIRMIAYLFIYHWQMLFDAKYMKKCHFCSGNFINTIINIIISLYSKFKFLF